ncbi:MAG: LuxR C-terminal-related transcriptional regulator [Legionellaceae bacterium]|nr:LuxR C-terminal-related transcriptional regulator [Legionellaceae bacterium]
MPLDNFFHFIQTIEAPLSMSEFIKLLNPTHPHCLFIKNEKSAYCYANDNYIQLMGLQNVHQLRQLSDYDLGKNKADIKKYREHDQQIIDAGKILDVCEHIMPHYNQPIEKTMQGKLYPLFQEKEKPQYILGIVTPKSKLLKLDFDTIFQLTQKELDELLVKRSYAIKLPFGAITLSKMEIRTLVQMIKGSHAGEIAHALSIKQSTIESYIINIKNKLAVDGKSALIQLVLKSKMLQQIII